MTTTVPEVPHVDRALALIRELSEVPQQDLRYQLEKLRGYRDALFEHFAPFRVGDRVRLHRDVEIGNDSGWRGYDRMMQAGATATVHSVDWIKGAFVFDVMFDMEFRDHEATGSTRTHVFEPDKRHVFAFRDPEKLWVREYPVTNDRPREHELAR